MDHLLLYRLRKAGGKPRRVNDTPESVLGFQKHLVSRFISKSVNFGLDGGAISGPDAGVMLKALETTQAHCARRSARPVGVLREVMDLETIPPLLRVRQGVHLGAVSLRGRVQHVHESHQRNVEPGNEGHLVVGLEMFDHTYQDVLDLWSAGKLDQKDFLKKSHWYANWRFDFSLYREILEFIKENHIRLVALNIPNHIPPKIREGGIDNLRVDEKKHLPQRIDTSRTAHRDYLQNVFDGHKHHFRGEVEFENFYAAQSVWEDAMAEMISQHLKDDVMVVLAGNGHIQFKYGIPDRAYNRTGAAFRTIYLAPVGSEVERDIADYIWVTP